MDKIIVLKSNVDLSAHTKENTRLLDKGISIPITSVAKEVAEEEIRFNSIEISDSHVYVAMDEYMVKTHNSKYPFSAPESIEDSNIRKAWMGCWEYIKSRINQQQ
jgi:hypothetical protein